MVADGNEIGPRASIHDISYGGSRREGRNEDVDGIERIAQVHFVMEGFQDQGMGKKTARQEVGRGVTRWVSVRSQIQREDVRPDAERKVGTWPETMGPMGVKDEKRDARCISRAPGGIFEVGRRGKDNKGVETPRASEAGKSEALEMPEDPTVNDTEETTVQVADKENAMQDA